MSEAESSMDEAKRELVRNWLIKAQHDLAAAMSMLASGMQAAHEKLATPPEQP